jgi:hypothetical protein
MKIEDQEVGVCKNCGSWGLVEQECDSCPEGFSMCCPSNEDDQCIVPPNDLTHHETVTMIVDHTNRSELQRFWELVQEWLKGS